MSINDKDRLNRIEELKNKLFSRNYETRIEHRGSFSHPDGVAVPDSWNDSMKSGDESMYGNDNFFMKTSRFKKFFIFSLIFFLLTIGYASYVFFFAGNSVSNNNIDISIVGNTFTAGGDDLSLVVSIANRNNAPLELVDLIVEYPKGGDASTSAETARFRESLGTIPAGSVRNENVKLVLFGEQGALRDVKVSIEYRVNGSNAIFVKEKPYEVTISSTPVNLLIDAPNTISPNQNIVLNVKSVLNATKPVPGVLLKVDYPAGFQFVSANPMPSSGNNVWSMGDLSPGVDRDISISGKMLDVVDGEEKSFRVSSGSQSDADKYAIGVVFNTLTHTVTVKRPFIEANILVNGQYQKEYANDSKNPIKGSINWSNNLDTKVNDLQITAKISGNAFNTKTVNAEQGVYNSLTTSMVWDKFSNSSFAEVNPGDSGVVNFTISPLALVGASGLLKDPSITIDVSISGKQLVEGYQPQELANSESKTIKIISDLGLTTKALYYSGTLKNTGPIPPQVEKETTYTVNWSLSNTANSISGAQVRAILPTWVRFMGPFAPSTEDVTFNSSTREVIWNIGKISKGTGLQNNAGKSVSFQIGFTPLFSQVGNTPVIINGAVLTGHDDFANVDIRVVKPELHTNLAGDPLFPSSGAVVSQ